MKKLTLCLTFIIICSLTYIKCNNYKNNDTLAIKEQISINDLPCVQLDYWIQKYCKEYDIPTEYAYRIAFLETRYKGKLDSSYTQKHKSICGALGPFQVMPSTVKRIYNVNVSNKQLNNDIQLNTHVAMLLLRRLKDKYKEWGKVFGAYNSGKPIKNYYAREVIKVSIK